MDHQAICMFPRRVTLATQPLIVSLQPSTQAVQALPRGHLAQWACGHGSQCPPFALYPSRQEEQQLSLQLQFAQCGSSQGSHLPNVALYPGRQVLQYVGSVAQLIQLGSVQPRARLANKTSEINLSIVIIITKILHQLKPPSILTNQFVASLPWFNRVLLDEMA